MTAIVWKKILSVLLYIIATTDASSNLRSTSGSDIEQNEVHWENLRSTIMEDGQIYHDRSRRNTKSKKSTKSKKAKRSKSKKSEVVNTADTNNQIFSRTSKIKTEEEVQIETAAPTFVPSTSASPSSIPSSSPTLVFDLGNCETYDYYWKKDLYHTCGSDWSTCECKGASWRIEKGDIDCATATCPFNCDVCYFCLMEVNPCINF
ncbi:predicted protein [Chaetoceros tenuissimus]|uniref:Uncharacterized protein n=1 Tax=Chaetoceros tenuissimus TaxID=426638 RepID=A0AAD3H5C0_9STRA|nr:predicted protein [Chaetoceros tenuissimus]